MSRAFAQLQKVLPQHVLSRLAGGLGRSRTPWIAQPLIRAFARHYDVDLAEAARTEARDYASFNDFFTRALQPGARPLPEAPTAVVSPADGFLSQFGRIEAGRLVQAKGQRYALRTLVADAALADTLDGGDFCTVYLSPRDYHRVHAPCAGRLVGWTAVPGKLFSVNAATEAGIPSLFCRNERLVCVFEDFAVVLVGALIVASIETVWDTPRSPYRTERRGRLDRRFLRGEEIGRFLLGSTVITLFPPGAVALDAGLRVGQRLAMGQSLGHLTRGRPETP